MKKSRLVLCFLLTIFLLVSSISAYGIGLDLPEPSRYFYVYDEANIIDNYLEDYIISTNEQLYRKTGAQIVVATLNSLNGNSEQEIAVQLFRKWGIGSKEKNNGVLMLIAPNEQILWIEIGYGLEGALPDGKVGEIRDKQMFPHFKEKDYNTGILKGFDAILAEVVKEYNIERPDNSDFQGSYDEYNNNGIRVNPLLVAIGIIVFLIIDFKFFGGFLTMMILRSSGRGGFRGGRGGGGNRGGGGSSGGGGAGGRW